MEAKQLQLVKQKIYREIEFREIGREHFASVLTASHIEEEFVLKKIFCKYWDQEGKKFPKKVKILNELKIQKHITNIKKVVCKYDRLYSK